MGSKLVGAALEALVIDVRHQLVALPAGREPVPGMSTARAHLDFAACEARVPIQDVYRDAKWVLGVWRNEG
jgi:hypothetical protein